MLLGLGLVPDPRVGFAPVVRVGSPPAEIFRHQPSVSLRLSVSVLLPRRSSVTSRRFRSANVRIRLGLMPLRLTRSACRTRSSVAESRGVAQLGSAPALGAGGRRFESVRPDQRPTCGCSSMVEPLPSKQDMPVRSRSPAPHIPAGQGIEQAPPTPPTGQACPYRAPIESEQRAGKDSCGHLSPFSGIRDRGLAKRPACSLSPTINPSSQLVSSRTEMRPEAGSTPHLQSVMTTFPQFSDSVAFGKVAIAADPTRPTRRTRTDAPACCASPRARRDRHRGVPRTDRRAPRKATGLMLRLCRRRGRVDYLCPGMVATFGWVSYMRWAAKRPEAAVRAATA